MTCRLTGVRFQPFEVAIQSQTTIVFSTMDILARHLIPHLQEDGLQRINLLTLYATMHVVPRAHLLSAFDIVVGHIHAPGIGYLAVDDNNLAVVTTPNVIEPREPYRVELIDFYPTRTDAVNVPLPHRLVVGDIAKAVEEEPDLNPLLDLGHEMADEHAVDGVIAKVEILHVDRAPSLVNGFEQVVELLLTIHQQRDTIVVRELYAELLKMMDNERVSALRSRIRILRRERGWH